jgi:hypothetical protein
LPTTPAFDARRNGCGWPVWEQPHKNVTTVVVAIVKNFGPTLEKRDACCTERPIAVASTRSTTHSINLVEVNPALVVLQNMRLWSDFTSYNKILKCSTLRFMNGEEKQNRNLRLKVCATSLTLALIVTITLLLPHVLDTELPLIPIGIVDAI